ncbi:MAG: hypothetical protein OXF97_04100 [Nitrospira sp.]|nr:hypothetical protein [Nitrospira sp.]
MKLFSYVVARDYGFAPNPFFGICTLATCKPKIRKTASIGDWIIGTGSSQNNRRGYLVHVMRVTETMTFNEYWENEWFQRKKPNLRGSKKQAFGDNIYYKKDGTDQWHQQDSHHSYRNGVPNPHNIVNDTQVDRILLSTDYAYWGGAGPKIPQIFRDYDGDDICAGRGHKRWFPESLGKDFVEWFRSLNATGYLGAPLDWARTP